MALHDIKAAKQTALGGHKLQVIDGYKYDDATDTVWSYKWSKARPIQWERLSSGTLYVRLSDNGKQINVTKNELLTNAGLVTKSAKTKNAFINALIEEETPTVSAESKYDWYVVRRDVTGDYLTGISYYDMSQSEALEQFNKEKLVSQQTANSVEFALVKTVAITKFELSRNTKVL